MYGCTLLGMLITDEFVFSYQMGDGDIMCVDSDGVRTVIDGDHILGVETHSLSGKNAWEKSVTNDILEHTPRLYLCQQMDWLIVILIPMNLKRLAKIIIIYL